jgi:poly(3-hydroxybutyrate) depolymerase
MLFVKFITTAILALGSIVPPPLPDTQSNAESVQPGCRTFAETGKTVCGRFLQYWDANGGLAQQGYPISSEMQEKSAMDGKSYMVQYFERAVFELHPENQAPYDVLLSLLGVSFYRTIYGSGAVGQTPNSSPGSIAFPQTGKRLGGLFLDYWQEHGGLAQQGYPISDEFTERSTLDGQQYTVQYFERAVFENHDGTVLLSFLGSFEYEHKAQLQSRLLPGPDSSGVVQITLKYAGATRHVLLVVPRGYRPGQPVPLVIVLHGAHGNGPHFYESTPDISAAAHREGFIAAYPTGLPALGSTNPKNALWGDQVNQAYIPFLMDYMQVNYSIDVKRIYAVGFSGGAKLCYELASNPATSGRIAAIGTTAGSILEPGEPGALTDPQKSGGVPMSAFLVQGAQDEKLPINGGPDEDGVVQPPFEAKVDIWVRHTDGTPAAAPGFPTVPRRNEVSKWGNPQSGYAVVSVIDPALAHKWPEWDLMSAIWSFFESVPTR